MNRAQAYFDDESNSYSERARYAALYRPVMAERDPIAQRARLIGTVGGAAELQRSARAQALVSAYVRRTSDLVRRSLKP